MPPHPNGRWRSMRSLWRIRSYVRPYRGQMILMVVAAGLAVGASIVVPLVTAKVVDGPIADGDKSGLIPLGLLALILGALEALLVFIRRWVQSYAALGIETAIRDDLYAHRGSLARPTRCACIAGVTPLTDGQRPICPGSLTDTPDMGADSPTKLLALVGAWSLTDTPLQPHVVWLGKVRGRV